MQTEVAELGGLKQTRSFLGIFKGLGRQVAISVVGAFIATAAGEMAMGCAFVHGG